MNARMRGFSWLFGVGVLALFAAGYAGIAAYVTDGARRSDWRNWQRGYEPQSQIDEYGERAQNLWASTPPASLSAIQQPWCFWSALAFSVAGLLTLLWLDFTSRNTVERPLVVPSWASIPLGVIMVWMGPGSMMEHGTLRKFLGWFDAASIHWYAIYVSVYVALRWIPGATGNWGWRAGAWGLMLALGITVGAIGAEHGETLIGFTIGSLVLMGILLVADAIRDNLVRPNTGYTFRLFWEWNWRLLTVVLCTGVAFLFLFLSRKGGPFESFGHGFWHVFIAAVTFFIYLHLRQQEIETPIGS